jgi:hypothetical protein
MRARNQREQVAAASEMSVHTRSALCLIPENDILHSHRREYLKPYTNYSVFMKQEKGVINT